MTDYFEIPLNLKREPLSKKPRIIKTRTKWTLPKAPFAKRPPKGKSWKDAELTNLHLTNECLRIGSGHRRVWARIGRKWVNLCDRRGNRGRVTIAVFERLRSSV